MAWIRTSGDNGGKLEVKTASGDIASFETNLAMPLKSVLVNVLATGGNGTPDNPNPINGYSEANITRCGVNLWDEEWKIITQSGRDWITNKNPMPVQPNHTYYISSPLNASIDNVSATGSYISYIGQKGNETFTTPSNCHFIRFLVDTNNYGTTYNNDISINYPATDTTYHAYNGQTYAIAFGQTVYGGVLDVTRGKLTVTHKLLTLNGSEEWSTRESGVGTLYELSIDQTGKANVGVSNMYVYEQQLTQNNTFRILASGIVNVIAIHDDNRTDLATFKTFLSNNNLQIVSELATPVDIDLTPVQIRALVGTNNVFAGCGSSTVEYVNKASTDVYKSIWDGVIPHSNTYIDQNSGAELSSVNWSSTDYLDVSGNTGLLYRAGDIASSGYGAFYDENKVYVGACNRAGNDGSHAIPSGAKYVRLSQADSSFYGLVVIKV